MNTQIIRPPAFQRPSGKLYLTGDQLNLVDTVWTLVELNTIFGHYTDGIENVATHRITPGVAGFYSIVGQVFFKNLLGDRIYGAAIRISNVDVSIFHQNTGPSGTSCSALCNLPNEKLSAVDYIELFAASFSGINTVDIAEGLAYTYLSVQRVR